MDTYPIEVDFPDIAVYASGNTGIPYVYTFDSGTAGPHVMINALTHGNEVCGAIIVDELLRARLRPRRGRLTLSFANVDAYARFDPATPDKARFVDQDFNRVWTDAKLDDLAVRSSELDRARVMRRAIDAVDLLLDLHSMHEKSVPLIVAGPLKKGTELAIRLGTPGTVICDEGHPEGRRMRDYEGFGDEASPKNALLIECGQHWEKSAVTVARDCTARFLLLAGIVDESDLPAGWFAPLPDEMRVVRVTEPVVARSNDFRFAAPYTGLEVFEKAGTVIGWSDGRAIVTPYNDCVLVMPSLRQLRPGVTVARFGRIEQEKRQVKVEQGTPRDENAEAQRMAAVHSRPRSFVDLKAFASDASQGVASTASPNDDRFLSSRRFVDLLPGPVTAGVITLAADTGAVSVQPADEILVVSEGSITLKQAQRTFTLEAGSSAVIPRGANFSWSTQGPVSVIFMRYRGGQGANSNIVPIDDAPQLEPSGTPPAELLLTPAPQCRNQTDYRSPDGQLTCGTWDSTPYQRTAMSYPHYELMHLLEGSVTLMDEAGRAGTFLRGDVFLVEQHARCSWDSRENVAKVYAIYRPT